MNQWIYLLCLSRHTLVLLRQHLHQQDELVAVLAQLEERPVAQLAVLLEGDGVRAVQEGDEVPRELERRALEADVPAVGGEEEEAEVDVESVALVVQEDVAVAAVLDLDEETHDGIRLRVVSRRDKTCVTCCILDGTGNCDKAVGRAYCQTLHEIGLGITEFIAKKKLLSVVKFGLFVFNESIEIVLGDGIGEKY